MTGDTVRAASIACQVVIQLDYESTTNAEVTLQEVTRMCKLVSFTNDAQSCTANMIRDLTASVML